MFGPKPMFLSPGNEFKALIWTSEVCSRLYKPCTQWATPISTPLTRCAHDSIMIVSIICNTSVTVWSHTHRACTYFVQKKINSKRLFRPQMRPEPSETTLHTFVKPHPFLPSNQSHVHVIKPWLCVMNKVFGPCIPVFVSEKRNFKALMKASNACSILLSKARTTDSLTFSPIWPCLHT